MANEQPPSSTGPWILEYIPLIIVILIAAHVFAMVYWIYRLASQKQPPPSPRRKAN